MPLLYLIRHPLTQPDPAIPASGWRLSDAGHAQVRALAAAPFWRAVTAVYTSRSYKAAVVGEAVHTQHGIPFEQVQALEEARRDTWMGMEAFRSTQRLFFDRPDQPPHPEWEAADAARARFVAAMDGILKQHALTESLAVVAHGTVLTLYVAHLRGEVPSYDGWERIGFAAVMAVDRASLRPLTAFLAAPYDGLPVP
ncbi:MAG: histidine phosphatase family protein [Anaerolineae bacterium]|nr:histidine phosphatase family protein [Anaerolineae bacterium]